MTRRLHCDGHTSHSACSPPAPQPAVCPSSPTTPRPTGDQATGCDPLPMTPHPSSSSSGVRLPRSHALSAARATPRVSPGSRAWAHTQVLAGQAVLGVSRVFHAEEQVVCVVGVQHEDLILIQDWKGDQDRAEVSSSGGSAGQLLWSPPGKDWAGSASCTARTPTCRSPFPKAVPRPINYGCARDVPPPPGLRNTQRSIQDAPREPEWSRNGTYIQWNIAQP